MMDFGVQLYDRATERELVLANQGKVPFDFNLSMAKLSRPGVVEALPPSGTVQPLTKETIRIRVGGVGGWSFGFGGCGGGWGLGFTLQGWWRSGGVQCSRSPRRPSASGRAWFGGFGFRPQRLVLKSLHTCACTLSHVESARMSSCVRLCVMRARIGWMLG